MPYLIHLNHEEHTVYFNSGSQNFGFWHILSNTEAPYTQKFDEESFSKICHTNVNFHTTDKERIQNVGNRRHT
jgi:hypothetical protein